MIHGLNNSVLYAAKKITTIVSNGTDTKECRGTGFFIEKDGHVILVTNRHMVEPWYGNPGLVGYSVQAFEIESYQDYADIGNPQLINAGRIQNYNEFVFDNNPLNDVACLANIKLESGDMTIHAHIREELVADDHWINEKLSVCDTIAYPGFPKWYDRRNNTPIFRMGTIASDPRLDYSSAHNAPKASLIAYEGFSSGGSSGSPVFAIQKGFPVGDGITTPEGFYREVKLIGINAGHFTSQEGHSGISYFYKASVIKDIIDRIT